MNCTEYKGPLTTVDHGVLEDTDGVIAEVVTEHKLTVNITRFVCDQLDSKTKNVAVITTSAQAPFKVKLKLASNKHYKL